MKLKKNCNSFSSNFYCYEIYVKVISKSKNEFDVTNEEKYLIDFDK